MEKKQQSLINDLVLKFLVGIALFYGYRYIYFRTKL